MPDEEMVTMDIEVPDEMYEQLKAIAAELNTTVEELLSTALVNYVERETGKLEKDDKNV